MRLSFIHREAIYYVEELVSENEPLSEWQIKSIHQLILKNIDDKNAGATDSTTLSFQVLTMYLLMLSTWKLT